QSRLLECATQPFWRADRKTAGLIGVGSVSINGNCCVPELAQEPCAIRIVPEVNRDGAAGADHAAEFFQPARRIWNVVQAQTADGNIEAGAGERQGHGVRGFKSDIRVSAMLAGEVDLLNGNIDSHDAGRRI